MKPRDGVVFPTQAHPGEEVNRPVLAPQVSASDLKETARRKLEPLDRLARLLGGLATQTHRGLETSAIAETRGGGFFYDDDDVAKSLAAVAKLPDLDPSKEPQRVQSAPSLGVVDQAQGRPFLQRDLLPDGCGPDRVIPDDEDVVDDDLRPLIDAIHDIDGIELL